MDQHAVDIGDGALVRRLTQPCTNCDAGYFATVEPRPELKHWLDVNTPGWRFFVFKIVHEFIFLTKEHAMLFKLVWG